MYFEKEVTMNQRIQQFEPIWERIRIRLSCGLNPREDEGAREILSHPPPRLVRQTNAHWLLSDEDREQWMKATSQEERDAIMARSKEERDAIMATLPFASILDEPVWTDLLSDANQIRDWDAQTKQECDLMAEGQDM